MLCVTAINNFNLLHIMSLNRDAIGLKNIYIMVIVRLMYGGIT